MSAGAIICFDHDKLTGWDADKETRFCEYIRNFDTVRVISQQVNSFLLHRMWLDLIAKGMTEVVIGKAEFDASGRLLFQLYCRLTVTTLN
jgi:hypothetical protein